MHRTRAIATIAAMMAIIAATAATAAPVSPAAAFNAWFAAIPGASAAVIAAPSPSPDAGMSVVATTHIAPGDETVTIPLSHTLCLETVARSPLGPRLAPLAASAHPVTALAVFLLHQRAAGAASPWAPWLALLPTTVDAPHVWPPHLRALLAHDPVAASIDNHAAMLKAEFRDVVRPWLRAQGWARDKAYSFRAYLWARFVLDSRAWFLRGVRYMAPMADMFNFEPSAAQLSSPHRSASAGDTFAAAHFVRGGAIHVIADAAAAAGDEVAESYGDNTNDIYLQYHAFVPLYNPDECVSLPLPPFSPDSHPPLFAHLSTLITGLAIPRRSSVCVYAAPSPRPVVPQWVELLLTLAALSDADAAALADAYAAAPAKTAATLRAFAARWPFTTLHDAAAAALARYPTSAAADAADAAIIAAIDPRSRSADDRRRLLALRFLVERKRILASVLDHANDPTARLHLRKRSRRSRS